MKKIFLFFATLLLTASMWATTYTLQPGENQISAAMASLVDGDVIELQTGTYTEWNTLEFTTKVTLKAAAGATPTVQPNVIKIKNDFEANGIAFINLNKDNYLLRTGANVEGTIAIKNCALQLNDEVSDPVPYIYLSSNTVGNLVIDNCTFAPNAKTEGAIVYGLTTVNNFTMTNSTAFACGGTDLAVYMTGLTTATVDHCTFYNCGARVLYLKGNAMTSCAVSNCIVANAALVEQYGIATYGGTVDNVLYYNTKAPRSSDATVTGCINADPKFVDPANGNFNFSPDSPLKGAATDGSNIGDPRWKAAAGSLTFTFLTPAAAENAMNDYAITFNVLNPSAAAATVKIAYSYDNAAWTNIYTGAYNDTTACTFATRGLEEGNIYLRGAIVLDDNSDSSVVVNQFLTIVKDTQAPRAIANFEAAAENTSATLTWLNPTHDVPVSGSLLGEEDLLEGASIYGETATMEVENNTVKVTATAGAWAQVGISFDATAFENVQNVAFKVKGDPAVQLDVFVVQNGYDWWHKAFYPTEDWMTFKNSEWSKVDWHNNNPATTFDGNDVTNVMITIDNGVAVENSVYYLDSVMVNGTIAPSQYFEKTIIRRSEIDYPATITDGDAIYEGNAETTTDIIDPTKNYYYTAFAVDDIMNVSEPTRLLIEAKEDPTALHRVNAQTNIRKVLKQNCIFIIRDNKIYNVLGTAL